MRSININKIYILGIMMFSIIGVYIMYTRPSLDTLESKQAKAQHAENIGEPMLLGTAVPLVSDYINVALTGAMQPLGGDADPFEFMDGNENSKYTWWLPISFMRSDFDMNIKLLHHEATTTPSGGNCEGYIIIKEVNPGVNTMLDMSLHYYSKHILVEGIVHDCIVIPVSPEMSLKQLKLTLKGI